MLSTCLWQPLPASLSDVAEIHCFLSACFMITLCLTIRQFTSPIMDIITYFFARKITGSREGITYVTYILFPSMKWSMVSRCSLALKLWLTLGSAANGFISWCHILSINISWRCSDLGRIVSVCGYSVWDWCRIKTPCLGSHHHYGDHDNHHLHWFYCDRLNHCY